MPKAQAATKEIRGIHVFWLISGFFAIIISLDALFITFAVQTFPGEQVRNSYMLGLDYNKEVARRREQEQLGWAAEVGLTGAERPQLLVRMLAADQGSVTGLVVSASLHVAGERDDTVLDLIEVSPGTYTAPIAIRAGARLEATVSARRQSDASSVFSATKTLVLP